MKLSWKRAFAVGGFLAGLCGVLALAIAGADLLTAGRIAENKVKKENDGLKSLLEPGAKVSEATEISDDDYPSLKKYWTVERPNEDLPSRIYAASDKNGYGQVSLLIALYGDFSLGNVAVLENTESYGQTLQDGYLDKIARSEDKDKAFTEVKCGATYGAKMCRDMIEAAKQHFQEAEE